MDYEKILSRDVNRRTLLKAGLVAGAGLLLPTRALATFASASRTPAEKVLSFYNTHTGETLNRAVFWADGTFVKETLKDINHLLRDHRNDQVHTMDPSVIDLMYAINRQISGHHPIHIISGYRSPQTNALLRAQSQGVAKHSLHLSGQAIDLRIPGVKLGRVHRIAQSLQRGGVGYYPKSDFVHVDTGKVRSWCG